MKCLVVYYSLEGSTRLIANAIAAEVRGDVQELVPVAEIPSKGFMRFVWGGKQVMLRRKPELKPLTKNVADYDMIFIGTPVWAFTFAPAVRSFLESGGLKDKSVALFCCFGGSEGGTFRNLRKTLPGSRIIGQIGFREPAKVNTEESLAKARDWAKYMVRLAQTP